MNILPVNFQHYNYNTSGKNIASSVKNINIITPCLYDSVSFKSANKNNRTHFISKDEKAKYKDLLSVVNKDSKHELARMLKSGILLNSDSNDKSTVLDNLYNMAMLPRANGLDRKTLLNATITILSNPYSITQLFGNIPAEYQKKAVDLYISEHDKLVPTNMIDRAIARNMININHSGTCVAASIEFNLAKQHPAEFARFAEGLSSHKMSVDKVISLKNLADNTLDAIWLLNAFEIPYLIKNFDKAKLTFKPDKNAIFRAFIQTIDKDPLERSVIDVLMQSTFMNIGSQQAYDTLIDKRKGKFNSRDKGLIEFEKTFTESIVENKNKISVKYQTVDNDGKLVGYETDFDTMKKQILKSLALGENVIIGYTQLDENMKIINGHEITIIGARRDDNNKIVFICNDTDDNNNGAIEYNEDFLLPKIHHAALPQKIAKEDLKLVDNWVEGLKIYRELKDKANSLLS